MIAKRLLGSTKAPTSRRHVWVKWPGTNKEQI